MRSSLDDSLPTRELQVLIIGGLPGSGATSLASAVLDKVCPNMLGNNWVRFAARELHDKRSQNQIDNGQAVKNPRTWQAWADRAAGAIWAWQRADVLVICTGTFLTPAIRKVLIRLGQPYGPERRLNHQLVWLHVDREVARRRLQTQFDLNGKPARHPDVFDRYAQVCEPPISANGIIAADRLNWSTESNVSILAANSDDVPRQTEILFEEIPGLRELRTRE